MTYEHKQIDGGGPAFPIQPIVTADGRMSAGTNRHGMSLRDYFAAKAMASIESGFWSVDCIAEQIAREAKNKGRSSPEHIAVLAYEMADAMLAARKGGAE